jgi:hypothetical protein
MICVACGAAVKSFFNDSQTGVAERGEGSLGMGNEHNASYKSSPLIDNEKLQVDLLVFLLASLFITKPLKLITKLHIGIEVEGPHLHKITAESDNKF